MSVWEIKVLYYGGMQGIPKSAMTPGLDPDVLMGGPYLGFLVQNGRRNILVDSGISESFFIDGRAWGGYKGHGGRAYVERALKNAGVDPLEIDTVLYTHLHNDHAANATLFKEARLIFQKDEWATLLDPLPVMQVRRDYDTNLLSELKTMNCIKVDGDFEFTAGIYCFRTPGHTPGSMSVAVQTAKGVRIMTGDHWHVECMAFGWQDTMTSMVYGQDTMTDFSGQKLKITPAPAVLGRFIPSSLIYDYYDYYDSCYKILAMMPEDKPEYLVPGHESSRLLYGV
ncbi:MAG: N-acyl homoserine lactonase family protein [Pseudomonadota bacterium]